MLPVISVGPFSISSYGIFLATGLLFGIFLVWRLSRAWDLPEEKVLDLTLLTFLGGLIFARAFFILQNFEYFGWDITKWLFIHKIGGFSSFGASIGGVLALKYFAKKFRLNFWQVLDFASIGVLGGLFFTKLGCFFGGCNIGIPSEIFAINMVGVVGKRFPVQLLEAVFYLFALSRMWNKATHFHIQGTIAATSLIYIALIMLISQPLRQDPSLLTPLILLILGITIFYKITKRKIILDIKILGIFLVNLFRDPSLRNQEIERINKSWYNWRVNIKWKARKLLKTLRRLNVRVSHKDSKYY